MPQSREGNDEWKELQRAVNAVLGEADDRGPESDRLAGEDARDDDGETP